MPSHTDEDNRRRICCVCFEQHPNNSIDTVLSVRVSQQKDSNIEKKCKDCLSLIARGRSHQCNEETRIKNLETLLASTPTKSAEAAISSTLRSLASKNSNSSSASVLSLTTTGRPMRVGIEPKLNPKPTLQIAAEDIIVMQNNLNLSQNDTLEIARTLREVTNNRRVIESDLKSQLTFVIHSVDEFFCSKKQNFFVTKGNSKGEVELTVVYRRDLEGLIEFVKEKRGVSNVLLKIGLDGGGGSLKICLSIPNLSENDGAEESSPTKVKGARISKRFSDAGVEKFFIIGLVESCQENYDNISMLWSMLKLNDIGRKYAIDLKVANLMAGLMAHGASFPCTWCHAPKDQLSLPCSEVRTNREISDHFLLWENAGAEKNLYKEFKNCIHKPIFTGDPDKPIIDIIVPPELHMMLGIVNFLYDNMFEEIEEVTLDWAKFCNVNRKVVRGGSGTKRAQQQSNQSDEKKKPQEWQFRSLSSSTTEKGLKNLPQKPKPKPRTQKPPEAKEAEKLA
ncbi:hypothetical protein QAD02_002954 [Eretmocerus hayati]|uniref:Uncharacterized protein n=1 Tax=Eretmocerus hayati TaxID=131215 RepID=A0ACC2NKC1_9HYME|nr:hypothetical protein QAD02_002954 [Eretmocerus hayati]